MSFSPSPGPSSKPKLSRTATPAEQQAAALNKLLSNPDREVRIPERREEGVGKSLRPPREMMKNVQGSSAGAGSGDFHVYKQSRRREYERLKLMDEEEEFVSRQSLPLALAFSLSFRRRDYVPGGEWSTLTLPTISFFLYPRNSPRSPLHPSPFFLPSSPPFLSLAHHLPQERQKREALERQRAAEAAAEEKTAKNRLKRQRKKEARGKPKGASTNGATEVGGAAEGEGGEKKRKLAGGAGFKFKTVDERDAWGGEEEDEQAGLGLQVSVAKGMSKEEEADELRRLQEEEARAQPAKEAGIVIQDDD
ncbi:Protein of unknown function (DUF1168)-domain containing protein [Rhodotorula toruloides]|uniref:DUF1168 domain protein n=1 Tax=Rhodotorula toruloides TaxID=5286 RepID=A0A2T0AEU8_RHOTO|nr:Protein of unknown function (DUF1168)-domain containing protein [Rhodotorula toruloides]